MSNNWKTVLIILISSVLLISIIIFNKDYIVSVIPNDNNYRENVKVTIDKNAKIKVDINKEEFEMVEFPEDCVLYYFVDNCPTFKDDLFIKYIVDDLENFFIPEKNSLVAVDKEHTWTKGLDNLTYWLRTS